MGPMDCLYTWRSTNGSTMSSHLDRLLCSIELVEHYLLANVRSLLRPLSDHTQTIWGKNKGQQ